MIRCIAIDDEPRALSIIQSHVDHLRDVELVATFYNPIEALQFLHSGKIDVVFLDIDMKEFSGIKVAEKIRLDHPSPEKLPLIVFTTAFAEYALESYNVEATDYLLKPFNLSRFTQSIQRIRQSLGRTEDKNQTFVFVKDGSSEIKIVLDDLLFVKGSGNYVEFISRSGTQLVRMPMNEVLQLLHLKGFVQIHRSHVVALNKISRIDSTRVWIGTHQLSIGGKYRDDLLQAFDGMTGRE